MSSYRTRRTLKPADMDSGRPVAAELLREILADATWAPTHGLTQPWRFDVFTGPARVRLAAALQGLYDEATPVAARNDDKRAKLGRSPLLAPVVVAVTAIDDVAQSVAGQGVAEGAAENAFDPAEAVGANRRCCTD